MKAKVNSIGSRPVATDAAAHPAQKIISGCAFFDRGSPQIGPADLAQIFLMSRSRGRRGSEPRPASRRPDQRRSPRATQYPGIYQIVPPAKVATVQVSNTAAPCMVTTMQGAASIWGSGEA